MKMSREDKKFWTMFISIIAVVLLMSTCSRGHSGHGYHGYHGSSWFFWNSGPSYRSGYDNSHRAGSVNGNRRYSGSGSYHSGK